MKLYSSLGPNPRTVRMFLAEKGVAYERVEVNLPAGENRQPPFLAMNPAGQTPVLELDDGQRFAEIIPLCEYIEEIHPDPPLIGTTAEERARTRMWARRIDLNICEPMANGFRYSNGLPIFKDRVHCIPAAADDLKATAREWLARLDGWMGERPYIVGDKACMADILLFCFLEFGAQVGQPLDPANTALTAWRERMAARPSAAASAP